MDLVEEVENVRVVIRVRPLSEQEIQAGYRKITNVNSITRTVSVTNPHASTLEPSKSFTFDIIFDTDSNQVCYIYIYLHVKFHVYA